MCIDALDPDEDWELNVWPDLMWNIKPDATGWWYIYIYTSVKQISGKSQ